MWPIHFEGDVSLSSHRKSSAKCQDLLLRTFAKTWKPPEQMGGYWLADRQKYWYSMKLQFANSSFGWMSFMSWLKEEVGSWGSKKVHTPWLNFDRLLGFVLKTVKCNWFQWRTTGWYSVHLWHLSTCDQTNLQFYSCKFTNWYWYSFRTIDWLQTPCMSFQ